MREHVPEPLPEHLDGLFSCSVCGGAEGSLPTECPGVRMGPYLRERVYAGRYDFRDGRWVVRPRKGLVIRLVEDCSLGFLEGVSPWPRRLA